MTSQAQDIARVKELINSLAIAQEQDEVTPRSLHSIQSELDKIAKANSDKASFQEAAYLLYELQSLIHYINNDYELAKSFASEAGALKPQDAFFESNTVDWIVANLIQQDEFIQNRTSFREYIKYKNDNEMIFFQKSPTAVALMSFFTFNLYNLYWFYKHWKYISLSTKDNRHPILAAFFQAFTATALFRNICKTAMAKGYSKNIDYGTFGALYFALLLGNRFVEAIDFKSPAHVWLYLSISLLMSLILALIVARFQSIANFSNDNNYISLPSTPKTYPGEVMFLIAGGLITVLVLFGTIGTLITNVYPRGTQAEIDSATERTNSLSGEYKICEDKLKTESSGLDLSNTTEVDSYNARVEDCEKVRLEQNSAVDKQNYLMGY